MPVYSSFVRIVPFVWSVSQPPPAIRAHSLQSSLTWWESCPGVATSITSTAWWPCTTTGTRSVLPWGWAVFSHDLFPSVLVLPHVVGTRNRPSRYMCYFADCYDKILQKWLKEGRLILVHDLRELIMVKAWWEGDVAGHVYPYLQGKEGRMLVLSAQILLFI